MSISTTREATGLASEASGLASEAAGLARIIAARAGRANAMLGLIAGAYLMMALDSTVVNVAAPAIQSDLHFSTAGLAWIFNAYLLTSGGLLLLGGRLGDIFGRRRTFVTGVAVFTVASALAGFAASDAWLVAARGLQGVGAALAMPNTMALLATNFAEGAPRNRALSVYATVAISGASIGLIVGGILTTYASWRWSMFINLPIGAAVAYLAPQLVEDTERRPGRLDVAGALSSTAAMTLIVFGLTRAGSDGWDGLTLGIVGVGLALLAAFIVIETTAAQPIVPLHLIVRRRAGAWLNVLLLPGALFGTFFFMTQFLQEVRGFGAFEAGLAFMPLTIAAIVAARVAPRLVGRYGPLPLMLAGGVLVLGSVLALGRTDAGTQYLPTFPVVFAALGWGFGWSFMPLNVTILSGVPGHEAGAASAVTQSMQWVGASLGLAILVTVFGSASRAAAMTASTARTPIDQAAVFAAGMSSALQVSAVFVVATLAIAVLVIRGRSRSA